MSKHTSGPWEVKACNGKSPNRSETIMLTKSLHTVAAATNVARVLFDSFPGAYSTAGTLAERALAVLGYTVEIYGAEHSDPTVRKIIGACHKIVAKAGV